MCPPTLHGTATVPDVKVKGVSPSHPSSADNLLTYVCCAARGSYVRVELFARWMAATTSGCCTHGMGYCWQLYGGRTRSKCGGGRLLITEGEGQGHALPGVSWSSLLNHHRSVTGHRIHCVTGVSCSTPRVTHRTRETQGSGVSCC